MQRMQLWDYGCWMARTWLQFRVQVFANAWITVPHFVMFCWHGIRAFLKRPCWRVYPGLDKSITEPSYVHVREFPIRTAFIPIPYLFMFESTPRPKNQVSSHPCKDRLIQGLFPFGQAMSHQCKGVRSTNILFSHRPLVQGSSFPLAHRWFPLARATFP